MLHNYQCDKETAIQYEHLQREFISLLIGKKEFYMIYSNAQFGYEGQLVQVEVDLRRGIPAIDIVGLSDGVVRETRERVRSAIKNSGFAFPFASERTLISLSPADLQKEEKCFDLPRFAK